MKKVEVYEMESKTSSKKTGERFEYEIDGEHFKVYDTLTFRETNQIVDIVKVLNDYEKYSQFLEYENEELKEILKSNGLL